MTARREWTPELLAQARNLRASGLTVRQVADRMGVRYQQVAHAMRYHHKRQAGYMDLRRAKVLAMTEGGYSISAIAQYLGVSRDTVACDRKAAPHG